MGRSEHIGYIADELASNTDSNLLYRISIIAFSDDYLYDLLVDFQKAVPGNIKTELYNEIINYTEEKIRVDSLK